MSMKNYLATYENGVAKVTTDLTIRGRKGDTKDITMSVMGEIRKENFSGAILEKYAGHVGALFVPVDHVPFLDLVSIVKEQYKYSKFAPTYGERLFSAMKKKYGRKSVYSSLHKLSFKELAKYANLFYERVREELKPFAKGGRVTFLSMEPKKIKAVGYEFYCLYFMVSSGPTEKELVQKMYKDLSGGFTLAKKLAENTAKFWKYVRTTIQLGFVSKGRFVVLPHNWVNNPDVWDGSIIGSSEYFLHKGKYDSFQIRVVCLPEKGEIGTLFKGLMVNGRPEGVDRYLEKEIKAEYLEEVRKLVEAGYIVGTDANFKGMTSDEPIYLHGNIHVNKIGSDMESCRSSKGKGKYKVRKYFKMLSHFPRIIIDNDGDGNLLFSEEEEAVIKKMAVEPIGIDKYLEDQLTDLFEKSAEEILGEAAEKQSLYEEDEGDGLNDLEGNIDQVKEDLDFAEICKEAGVPEMQYIKGSLDLFSIDDTFNAQMKRKSSPQVACVNDTTRAAEEIAVGERGYLLGSSALKVTDEYVEVAISKPLYLAFEEWAKSIGLDSIDDLPIYWVRSPIFSGSIVRSKVSYHDLGTNSIIIPADIMKETSADFDGDTALIFAQRPGFAHYVQTRGVDGDIMRENRRKQIIEFNDTDDESEGAQTLRMIYAYQGVGLCSSYVNKLKFDELYDVTNDTMDMSIKEFANYQMNCEFLENLPIAAMKASFSEAVNVWEATEYIKHRDSRQRVLKVLKKGVKFKNRANSILEIMAPDEVEEHDEVPSYVSEKVFSKYFFLTHTYNKIFKNLMCIHPEINVTPLFLKKGARDFMIKYLSEKARGNKAVRDLLIGLDQFNNGKFYPTSKDYSGKYCSLILNGADIEGYSPKIENIRGLDDRINPRKPGVVMGSRFAKNVIYPIIDKVIEMNPNSGESDITSTILLLMIIDNNFKKEHIQTRIGYLAKYVTVSAVKRIHKFLVNNDLIDNTGPDPEDGVKPPQEKDIPEVKEEICDLWDKFNNGENICVTTNGFVKNNGEGVMGRGIASQAKDKFPEFPAWLGAHVKKSGNIPAVFGGNERILTLPVKHNWYETADVELIKKSIQLLAKLMADKNIKKIYIPRPGCGNGSLDWAVVKPAIAPYVTDAMVFCTYNGKTPTHTTKKKGYAIWGVSYKNKDFYGYNTTKSGKVKLIDCETDEKYTGTPGVKNMIKAKKISCKEFNGHFYFKSLIGNVISVTTGNVVTDKNILDLFEH